MATRLDVKLRKSPFKDIMVRPYRPRRLVEQIKGLFSSFKDLKDYAHKRRKRTLLV